MSGAHRQVGRPVVLLVLLMMGVLAAVVLARPGEDDATAPSADPAVSSTAPPSVLPTPAEEEFCAGFRKLAATQSEYAAAPDARAVELLRDAADELVGLGVPETMTLPARGGYHTVLEGIYASIGMSLDRSDVGALDEPGANDDAAFSSYLSQYCPA
ncbi:hypothetical protein SFC88_02150 [Nocardioides sp. HM23]|uniref:hypothetical protein n=1 Tax=Nocardioides bizhenqiangii TaxID=3095076 RepID=UPI002ACAE54A|nr:hypothetical protein [Nocardioides sp. HM23]MDZ5619606.1 hypothetical protein [Nocardioides sp. HM23]